MDNSKIKIRGTATAVTDDSEKARNLALLDEVVARLQPLMPSQMIVERVQKTVAVLDAHADFMAGKGVQL